MKFNIILVGKSVYQLEKREKIIEASSCSEAIKKMLSDNKDIIAYTLSCSITTESLTKESN